MKASKYAHWEYIYKVWLEQFQGKLFEENSSE